MKKLLIAAILAASVGAIAVPLTTVHVDGYDLGHQAGKLLHTSNWYQIPLQEQLAERLCKLAQVGSRGSVGPDSTQWVCD